MKTIIIFLYFICSISSSNARTDPECYIFKVNLSAKVFASDDEDQRYINYIYSGKYILEDDKKNIVLEKLEKYIQKDSSSKNIYLIFSDLIYIISFNNFKQEDDWNVISKAHITMIKLFPNGQEEKVKATLATGIIKFDPKVELILFIKTSIKEEQPKKDRLLKKEQFKKT